MTGGRETERQRVDDRWLDVALEMVEGRGPRPGLAEDVARQLRAAPALPRRTRRRWPSIALAAAAVVAVAGLGWLASAGGSPEVEVAREVEVAVVRSAVEVAVLPETTRAVRGLGLDAAALASLRRLRSLARLELLPADADEGYGGEDHGAVPALSDRGFATVATLRGLRSVSIERLQLSPAALARLSELPRLDALALKGVPLSDGHFDAVARLAGLRTLVLEGPVEAGAAAHRRLAALPQLEDLDLSVSWHRRNPPSDDPAARAAFARQLAVVDDALLEVLAGMPSLRRLVLRGRPAVTDRGLALLAALPLEALDLSGCNGITDAGLAQLPSSLRSLSLASCAEVGRSFPEHLTGLRSLVLSINPNLDDAQLARITALPELRALDLRVCSNLTAEGARALAGAAELEELFLCGSPWLDDTVMTALAQLPRLRELGMAGFGQSQLTGAGVAELARLPQLEVLHVSGIQPLAAADVRALAGLPLRYLDVSDNRIAFDRESPDVEALRGLWSGIELRADRVAGGR